MKKIFLLFAALVLTVFTATAQKWSVDHFEVNQARMATVYLINEKSEVMVKNLRVFVNPTYNQQGMLTGGSLDNRGGLMLTPPIRPGIWESDGGGNKVPVNFGYNTGCSPNTALVYIIEGYIQSDGSITFSGREETVEFSTTFNSADWVRQYSVDSYTIPYFCLPVQVTKHYASARYFGK